MVPAPLMGIDGQDISWISNLERGGLVVETRLSGLAVPAPLGEDVGSGIGDNIRFVGEFVHGICVCKHVDSSGVVAYIQGFLIYSSHIWKFSGKPTEARSMMMKSLVD